jgi:hypothetical protein
MAGDQCKLRRSILQPLDHCGIDDVTGLPKETEQDVIESIEFIDRI